jgi:hypothetical protein
MTDVLIVSDWDSESFHKKVLEMEAKGYVSRKETYRISPEVNPETGLVTHLYTIEMYRADENEAEGAGSRNNDKS